jgi:GT2 family glycosyltransferase
LHENRIERSSEIANVDSTANDGKSQAPGEGGGIADGLDALPVESRDLENCVAIFLGRKPGPELLDRRRAARISEILREFFETEEFQNSVLRPLLLREPLPQALLENAPSMRLIDWAQRRLPLGEPSRRALGAARTWTDLLEILFADRMLVSHSRELVDAEIDSTLWARVESQGFWKVKRSVTGAVDAASSFEVRGWAVDLCDKSTPVVLEFFADNAFIGSVPCDVFRADVQDVAGGTGNFGFSFKISAAHRAGFEGGRTLTAVDSVSKEQIGEPITVYADAAQSWDLIAEARKELTEIRKALERLEARLPAAGRRASIPIEAYSEYWERFYRLPKDLLLDQRALSRQFNYRPLISVVVPTWNSDTRLLHKAIESVRNQSYGHWQLVLSNDGPRGDELNSLMSRYAGEPRILWVESPSRLGIAVNTNRAIENSSGDYIAFLDHDDELSPEALYQVANRLQERHYGMLYSDEDRIEEDELGRLAHHTPFFKPGFDPDLLLSMNYICHLVVLRRDTVKTIGGLRGGFEGAQDHDLLLRVVELLERRDILHLPRVLYHWRVTQGSLSGTPQLSGQIQNNVVMAVNDSLSRQNALAKAEAHQDPVGSPRQFATRVRWSLPANPPKLSIVIATRDRVDLLQPCLQSVLDTIVNYPGEIEILLVDNDSVEPATAAFFTSLAAHRNVRIVPFHGPFNWSAINNAAAREASGEVIVFLNNDTVVLTPDWCVELASHAMRPEVGAVGARLLYGDGTIQHSGVVLGIEGVAGHECVGEAPRDGGYFGRSHLLRSAAAVTGACLATRKALFEQMDGGFDELNLKVAFNDVDYCMRLRKAEYRIVYNPFAVLYHLESKSRGREVSGAQVARHRAEALFFRTRWSEEEIVDPYYNLHFERYSRPFDRLRPPPEISRSLSEDEFSISAKALPSEDSHATESRRDRNPE